MSTFGLKKFDSLEGKLELLETIKPVFSLPRETMVDVLNFIMGVKNSDEDMLLSSVGKLIKSKFFVTTGKIFFRLDKFNGKPTSVRAGLSQARDRMILTVEVKDQEFRVTLYFNVPSYDQIISEKETEGGLTLLNGNIVDEVCCDEWVPIGLISNGFLRFPLIKQDGEIIHLELLVAKLKKED